MWGLKIVSNRTRLVNLHTTKEGDYIFIGRPSKWGNPFIKGRDGTRQQVCDKYDNWFRDQIRTNSTFRKEIEELKGKVLACYCVPQRCHGQTIINYLNSQEPVEDNSGVVI